MPVRHARGCEVVYDMICQSSRLAEWVGELASSRSAFAVAASSKRTNLLYLYLSLSSFSSLFISNPFFFRDLQVTRRGRGRGEVGGVN